MNDNDIKWVDRSYTMYYVHSNGIKNNKVVYQILWGANNVINLIELVYDDNGVFQTINTLKSIPISEDNLLENINNLKSFCKSLERMKKITNIVNNN